MPATYEPIATTTLGSTTNTITFSNIPATYTDLRVVAIGKIADFYQAILRLNGSAGALYSGTFLRGNGSIASSARITTSSGIYYLNAGSETTPFLIEIDILSYASSTYKSFLTKSSEDRNGSGWVINSVGVYKDTAAITSVSLTTDSAGVWGVGTTATLYGIKAA